MKSLILSFAILAINLVSGSISCAEVLFESHCAGTEDWQALDIEGDGGVSLEEDPTVPVGYGPKVLSLHGGEFFLFARGVRFQEGTVLVLWKDHEPLGLDADGVIAFEADYSDNLSEAHNLKQCRHHYWIEQDGDDGFQLKEQIDNDNSKALVDRLGIGLTQDPWNRNGWIWQKLAIGEGMLRAKFWSSVAPEPEEWQIEMNDWKSKPGRVGLKLFSGKASVAYFAISKDDISIEPPQMELHVAPSICYNLKTLQAHLFFNLPEPINKADLELNYRLQGTPGKALYKEEKTVPMGFSELSFGDTNRPFTFPEGLDEGKMIFTGILRNDAGGVVGLATRTIELRSSAAIEDQSRSARKRAEAIIHSTSEQQDVVVLDAHSALAHLDLFDQRLRQGKAVEADKSLAYAEEALDPEVTFINYAIRDQQLTAESYVMGETYEASITLGRLNDATAEALTGVLFLSDDLRANTPLAVTQPIPFTSWNDGAVTLKYRFRLPEEFPAGKTTPIKLPAIREGYHRLYFSLHNGAGEPVWMDCDKPSGTDYKAGQEMARIYVTQNRLELQQLNYNPLDGAGKGSIRTAVRNCGNELFSGSLILRLRTLSGAKIWTEVIPVRLGAGETRILDTSVTPMNWFGEILLSADLYRLNTLETCAQKEIKVATNLPWMVSAIRETEVRQEGENYLANIRVKIDGPAEQKGTAHIIIRHQDQPYAEALTENVPGETVIPLKTGMGSYQVVVTIHGDKGNAATTEIPLIAPVFENREGTLYLNGEPFIVKGVNVHGMIPESPERNRHMMRFLKDIGFNMLRGDYPPVWEVDMAEEENLGWMVLAPFSVSSTDLLMQRFGTHAFPQMREVTRRFIRTYRERPAAWLWNSCNEVTNEIEDFLVTLSPQYKRMDPAQRPVVYANLFGQDKAVGQDLMAVNYYFGIPQSATSRQPLIERSLIEARKAGIPIIFTEFNCWYGPVYSKGIEAIQGIYEYGIDNGYSGGFLYLLAEDPERHPAVIATRENMWTNPSYIASLRQAFDDATVEYSGRSAESITLTIRNRRPFWLRKIRYRIEEGPGNAATGQLADIAPGSTAKINLTTASGSGDQLLKVDLDFETHQGLKSHVVKQVAVKK